MNDDQHKPDDPSQGEIVLTTVPESVGDEAQNETPTDLLARLHQQEDSRIEPDNEDG
ncbi:hypothetical protein DAERI_020239 [Deinococcus aerius]|uniref:Uncharacterized protein n=2 Tax=Deinococcus TaxID=1298 RepID=A0A2I9CSJ2_9DEIO|nr:MULTISPECIES: hypothetical protein [Deinococcus]MBB5293897.1 hypothetical protein [Deinococcus metallilatus]GBF04642.1 hypothetical protein DAERI_020239 [Deinococcus aerius]GMA17829.1 hypothetical protein GCM10025871_41600 [Deinococcus metallilatus]